jgi:solute carrier family 26 (sodium-independent sulfate anion transporter), member 11
VIRFAGVIAAGVVLLAIYELTPVFFFVPSSTLAAVIIHAVVDMMVGPKAVKQFWRVSPTDVVIYLVGMVIILFSNIENGIYAMIAMSLALLLFRMFKAHGNFMGSVRIAAVPREVEAGSLEDNSGAAGSGPGFKAGRQIERTVFLPLDRNDGSNPKTKLSKPAPGVFIYRFAQDYNYTNANHYIDHLTGIIKAECRQTTMDKTIKPGVSSCP